MEVIARPFAKFWNVGDERHPETLEANLPQEIPLMTDKMDGSLGIHYRWAGDNYVATRGSFHSEQAEWATAWFRKNYPDLKFPVGWTFLSEILYAENQIVLDYDFEGLVTLGAVRIADGVELSRESMEVYCQRKNLKLVEKFNKHLNECASEDIKNREGYVATFPSNGLKVKIKFETYCQLHRILTGLNARSIWELLRDGEVSKIEEWLVDPKMPEQFKTWLRNVFSGLQLQHNEIESEAQRIFEDRPMLSIMLPYKESRKKMAEYFMKDENKKYSGFLFKLLDGKAIDEAIWKSIEPAVAATFKVEGE